MIATGKILHELGCPQKQIKKFVGMEYSNEDELKALWNAQKEVKEKKEVVENFFSYFCKLNELIFLPGSRIRDGKFHFKLSNNEIRNLLETKSIEVNGIRPQWNDPLPEFIETIIFFPNSEKRKTWIYHYEH